MEMVELPTHPWFLGCQFHPEFKSKPFAPHPIFAGLLAPLSRDASESRSIVTLHGAVRDLFSRQRLTLIAGPV